jgi:hypothetical protein
MLCESLAVNTLTEAVLSVNGKHAVYWTQYNVTHSSLTAYKHHKHTPGAVGKAAVIARLIGFPNLLSSVWF